MTKTVADAFASWYVEHYGDLRETSRTQQVTREAFEAGWNARVSAEPPAQCTCKPLAQQQHIGQRVVAVDPECPLHLNR